MEQFRIDEIARRLLESVPPAFRSMQQDLEANFRAVLRSSLGKLDLVTREEFDTQMKRAGAHPRRVSRRWKKR